MSFTSKNLQAKQGGMSLIKGATLFFLGASCVLFMAKASFEIEPIAKNALQVIQKIVFTTDGSVNSATGVFLDGFNGYGYFAGNVDVDGTGSFSSLCLTSDTCRTTRPTGATTTPGGSTGTIQFNNSGVFSGSTGLVWDTRNSRLGIGISSPLYKLDVVGTGHIVNALYFGLNGGFNPTENPKIFDNLGILYIKGAKPFLSPMPGLNVVINGGNPNGASETGNVILVNEGGKVGIGTTSPTSTLHIYHNTGSTITLAGGADETNKINFVDYGSPTFSIEAQGGAQTIIRGINSNPLVFATNNTEAMRIDAAGKVGIGTTSPTATLTVDGGIRPILMGGDPCSTGPGYPEGTIFYNSAGHYPCFCNQSGNAMKMDGIISC